MKQLRSRLSKVGVKRGFLNDLVLPDWWEDSIAETRGGLREAAGYIASRLGFSLESLLDETKPLKHAHSSAVKFKKRKGFKSDDVAVSSHFGISAARSLVTALGEITVETVPEPAALRRTLLESSDKPWVCSRNILDACWGFGIPVIHLRSLPKTLKKPQALTTMVGDRPVIVVFSGRKSPSWIAFVVAHELGHIYHKHLKPGETVVDDVIDENSESTSESEANDFAVRLLTGQPDLGLNASRKMNGKQLAAAVVDFGKRYNIAPGVAALNFAFTTGNWSLANGALSHIEGGDNAVLEIENAMENHVDFDILSGDTGNWLRHVAVESA